MDYVIIFVVLTAISWVTLMIVIPIARKLADFSIPPLLETMWKLAVVAAVGNAIAMALDPVNLFLSWVVGAAVFFGLLYKWFDADPLAIAVIVIVSWIVRALLIATLIAALLGGLAP